MIRDKMKMLAEMAEQGAINAVEHSELLGTLHDSAWKQVWNDDDDFDPRQLKARQQHSLSESLLEDILRTEKRRIFGEFISGHEDPEKYLDGLDDTGDGFTRNAEDADLLATLDALHAARGIGGIEYLVSLKHHPDFRDSPEIQKVTKGTLKEYFEKHRFATKASRETEMIPEAGVSEIHIHPWGFHNLDLTSADTESITLKIETTGFGSTQAEADADAQAPDFLIDREGPRLWIRSAALPPSPAEVKLTMVVPRNMHVFAGGEVARVHDFEGDLDLQHHNVEILGMIGAVTIRESIVGKVAVEHLRGDISVNAFNAPISIVNWHGDIRIDTVLGAVRCAGGTGRITARCKRNDVVIDDITTSQIDVIAGAGNLSLSGTTVPGGSYTMQTRRGDVRIRLTGRSDCGFIAESLGGEVHWSLPVRNMWDEPAGSGVRKYANVRLGSGSFIASSTHGDVYVDSADQK